MATKPPRHILVTAGSTREKIDAVRDWGNIFTGQTGLDLALAFLEIGDVTLLTSNEAHARAYDGYYGKAGMLGAETFRTHADLRVLLEERMAGAVDVVAMTAAVSDYAPTEVFRVVQRRIGAAGSLVGTEVWVVEKAGVAGQGKVKSTFDQIAVLGQRTQKLVDLFRTAWQFRGLLIKFKLEVGLADEELIRVASASRVASGADLMVANTLAMARPAAGEGSAYLIDENGGTKVGRVELAARVVAWTARKVASSCGSESNSEPAA